VLIFWGTFSVIYFILQLIYSKLDANQPEKLTVNILIQISLQLRNLSALFATTLYSLYTLHFNPESAYPRTVEGKLEALDFDTMMTSEISFKCFYEFVDDYAIGYKPYMQIYILTKMYQE